MLAATSQSSTSNSDLFNDILQRIASMSKSVATGKNHHISLNLEGEGRKKSSAAKNVATSTAPCAENAAKTNNNLPILKRLAKEIKKVLHKSSEPRGKRVKEDPSVPPGLIDLDLHMAHSESSSVVSEKAPMSVIAFSVITEQAHNLSMPVINDLSSTIGEGAAATKKEYEAAISKLTAELQATREADRKRQAEAMGK